MPISLPYQKGTALYSTLLYHNVTMLKMTPETSETMDVFLNFYANFIGVL